MDITFYNDIENIFTQQRLSVFKQDGVDEITCVARYLYNYERLIHWKDLKDQHLQLLECIKWLSVEAYNVAKEVDTFDKVYNAGLSPLKKLVQDNWN